VEIDASSEVIGVVLKLNDSHTAWQNVVFLIKKLLPADQMYTTYNHKLLGVLKALAEWGCLIEGASMPENRHTD
jgi:RNase H-like domain found in reverse transcriptase